MATETIASLLTGLHYATGRDNLYRFFSYAEETRQTNLVPYAHTGFSTWLEADENGVLPQADDMD